MPTKRPVWAYTLPAAMLLMAPFDILASLAMDIYLPVVPAMPGILQTDPAVIQLTLSLYMIVLGAGQVMFGPISDRIGRRPVLLGGALLFALSSFGLAASSTVTMFLAFRLLQAIGASAALVATFATVRDVYAERPEGAVIYGLFSSILSFVPALGPIAGALIANGLGWRAIFVLLGSAGTLAAINALWRWHETLPVNSAIERRSMLSTLRSPQFWTYTLGFATAMGTFFVFFSTAPRVLIDRAGYSELTFSFVFASVAVVMIATTAFAKRFVTAWGIAGSAVRGMMLLLAGAGLLSLGQVYGVPSFVTFVMPMWIMAVGIVLISTVTANGALEGFGDIAGSAVAVYSCIQSLIVGLLGSLMVVVFEGDTAWPLVAFSASMAVLVLIGIAMLGRVRSISPQQ